MEILMQELILVTNGEDIHESYACNTDTRKCGKP